jgi:hypothetical protein
MRPSASYRGERGSPGPPSGRGGEPDGDTGPAAAGAYSGAFPGACWPGTTSAQGPARSACWRQSPNLAQARTDLQGVSHAERNWSDKGWRIAAAVGVPGLVVVADLLGHARLDTVRACTRATEDNRTKALNLLPTDR